MGINNLFLQVKQYLKTKHIQSFKGKRIAVDTYCWLHKAIYSCSIKCLLDDPTENIIQNCLKKVEQLQNMQITLVMVFDGGFLPSKGQIESQRKQSRQAAYDKGLELLGDNQKTQAQRKLAEAFDINPSLANRFQRILVQKYNIECIVAPYEADAQLAYLSKIDYIDAVLTEDSDLLAFGAKQVLYKLDSNFLVQEAETQTILNGLKFDQDMFLTACILSGCDYLASPKRVGVKTAFKWVQDHRSFKNIMNQVRMEGKLVFPENYENDFWKALATFKFQRVFCPKQ